MACALPWVKDQHIPNIFQHCQGKWGEGEVTRNVTKKYNLHISGPNVLNFEFVFFFFLFFYFFLNYLHGFFHVCARL